jgi:biopolymer transport protein ExbD
MAGSQDAADNPVAINVVPMVDVIFCLCVFFMCSFKFKELEGKFESWLPKDKGAATPSTELPSEIRVALFWDKDNHKTVIQLGHRVIKDDAELQALIRDSYADALRNNKPDTPVILDGDKLVPWNDIVKVMNLAKREKITKIEFAFGQNFNK